jgi:hypothetical protein
VGPLSFDLLGDTNLEAAVSPDAITIRLRGLDNLSRRRQSGQNDGYQGATPPAQAGLGGAWGAVRRTPVARFHFVCVMTVSFPAPQSRCAAVMGSRIVSGNGANLSAADARATYASSTW